MNISCDNCKGQFRIADDKLPENKTAFVKCPKCQNRISVPPVAATHEQPPGEDFFSFDEEDGDSYDSSDKPFDFVEEEGKTALLCEPDPMLLKAVKPVLDVLEYHITEVKSSRDALKKMRYHSYDLIVVNEFFDTNDPDANGVLIYLERLNMAIRRNIFAVMITNRFRTMDNMKAFQKSVNMVVNVDNITDFDKILRRGMADYGIFYQVYKECAA
jgi:predicted Zn finger-like uncharacterized protein